ncbi:MAG: hypothetical protein M3R24_11400 [Chloroflexota bacterium]|nr:hypothetical protein [Chloroflexota bacterium]
MDNSFTVRCFGGSYLTRSTLSIAMFYDNIVADYLLHRHNLIKFAAVACSVVTVNTARDETSTATATRLKRCHTFSIKMRA